MFKTLVVGRSPEADIEIKHISISRLHMELTLADNGKIFCLDRLSTSGSFVWRDNIWQRFTQSYIEPHETLRLGERKILLSDLLQRVTAGKSRIDNDDEQCEPLSVKPRRNSETGEIE